MEVVLTSIENMYRCKILIITSDQNLKILLAVKNIFLEAFYDYCIINLSKNLMTNVLDKKIIKLLWAIVRAPTMYKFHQCIYKLRENH